MSTPPLFSDETTLTPEKQILAVLESISDGFVTLDTQWRYTYMNRAAEAILQKKREDVLGQNVWDVFPKSIDTIFWQKYKEAADTQTAIEFEEFSLSYNKWFHVRVYPSEAGIALYFQDTTEKAQQDERVAHMQARLIELAHDAIIVRDPASVIISWNRGAEALYGWTAREALGQTSHILLKTQFPHSREALDAFLATGEQWRGELVHTRRDGAQVTVESRQVLLRNEEGQPVVVLEINRDITDRKQQERENQEQYRTIVRTANEGIWLIDKEAHTLYVNERLAEMLGYSVEEMAGRRVPEFVFPEDQSQARERIGQNLQGSFEQFDFRFQCKDGSPLYVLACTSPVRDGQGEIAGALAMFTDLTERKQAEVDQLRLAAIVESSDDAIASKTLDGIITSWNLAAERIFGYTAQEAIGQPIYLIIPPELRAEEDTIISKLRRGERIDHFETVRRRKDGTRIDVALTISPIKNKAGQIIGASKIARNITEQKRMQRHLQSLYQEVQQSRDQLEIILQGVADGIVVYDKEGHIIYANETAAQMTASTSVQAMLETPPPNISARYEIIDEQRQPVPRSGLPHMRVLAGEQEVQAIMGYRSLATGQPERWSLLKSRPVFDEHREIAMVVTIIHDITEQVAAEQRKDEFISMASHELKTPVTSLKGFTNLLQRRLAKQGDTQALHYLDRMETQLNRLTKLIGDLLDISRMQVGKLALDMETFDLDTLVQETVENVQATTETHQFFIEGETKGRVQGDRDRLGQVFINLLTNAARYSPQGNKVMVHLSQDHGQAIVGVQDFGIGIDQVHLKKIFERFYQVADPDKQTTQGLGIGLYISRDIVDRHHGRIEVHSRRGKGSTFTVILPLLSDE